MATWLSGVLYSGASRRNPLSSVSYGDGKRPVTASVKSQLRLLPRQKPVLSVDCFASMTATTMITTKSPHVIYIHRVVSLHYILRSVVVHHGNTLYVCHFVAYQLQMERGVEGAIANEWILSSDRYVDLVPFTSVQDCQVPKMPVYFFPDAMHSSTSTECMTDEEGMDEVGEEDELLEKATKLK
ncbi:ubiquitin specific peptidase 30 (C19 family) [Echinococcus multilocularis]|uniref:Ubiquitin specific peptidase 30 (C19 family) n=1 Tax=Echinococcus multilocularis TaxID=6211 RepID=A0A0S4MMA1_ECHMU|nr:ubiquitin specific peptidase 30 (C19 family) [Echinococcus multilocularis]